MNFIPFGNERLKVEKLSENAIRFSFSKDGKFIDSAFFPFLEEVNLEEIKLEEGEKEYYFATEHLNIIVEKNPPSIKIFNKEGFLIHSDYEDRGYLRKNNEIYTYKKILNEKGFFGTGVRRGHLNKKNSFLINWNTDDPNHFFDTDPLYQCHPFFIAFCEDYSYGIFFENTHRSYFDFGKENPLYYYFHAESGNLIYYFFYGPSIEKVLEEYTKLTGRMPIPPLWALGLHQSRWSYKNQSQLKKVAKEFRKRNIPCDVLYLDIDYMEDFKVFTINKKRFPNMKGLLESLKKEGFKTVAIVDPGVKYEEGYNIFDEGKSKDYFCKDPDGTFSSGYVWPGKCVFPDFYRKEVREWWAEKQKFLLENGIDGIWNDMNEPAILTKNDYFLMRLIFNVLNFKYPPAISRTTEFVSRLKYIKMKTLPEETMHGGEISHSEIHNIYGYLMTMASYQGLKNFMGNKRFFILSRAGFCGIQKYSAVWAGDNQSSWENLYMSIPTLLNLSLSGVPFVGEDIGGFWRNLNSGELFVRWVQLGIFYPFFRIHTAVNTRHQEPWSFGKKYGRIAIDYIKLRYRLLPYLYSLFYETYIKGKPILRPLFFEFPFDRNSVEIEDEFMFGPSLLIAPVYEKGLGERKVYLPEGRWFYFYDNKEYNGGEYISVDTPLERIPIFVREGSIIPMFENAVNFVEKNEENNLIIKLYPGSGEFNFYEDDTITTDYEKGIYNLYLLRNVDGSLKNFRVEKIYSNYPDGLKKFFIENIEGNRTLIQL